MSPTVRIIADPEVCVGAGQCVRTAPDLFAQSEEGLVRLLDAEPSPEQVAQADDAVQACPSGALRIEAGQ